MKKQWLLGCLLAASMAFQTQIHAHCQMPCGIYHDDMVFDQIDQFVETTAKGISVLQDNKFETVQDHNEFVRWVNQKEQGADEVANILTTFFLQQKIKPGEEDTAQRVIAAHKLLFLLVPIKQTVDLKFLNDFYEEWERFKLMFHIEGYECKMEQIKLKEWAKKREKAEQAKKANGQVQGDEDHDHDHGHDHDHDHSH